MCTCVFCTYFDKPHKDTNLTHLVKKILTKHCLCGIFKWGQSHLVAEILNHIKLICLSGLLALWKSRETLVGVKSRAEILETHRREKAEERRSFCLNEQGRETVYSMERFIGMLCSSEALWMFCNTTIICLTRMTLLSWKTGFYSSRLSPGNTTWPINAIYCITEH